MRKYILVFTAIFTLGLTLSLPATRANAAVHTKVCTHNGLNFCLGITNLVIGNNVVQKADSQARFMDLITIDGNCTVAGAPVCTRVYMEFYNGDRARSTSNCGPNVVVGSPTESTGVVWWWAQFSSGISQFLNQNCGASDATGVIEGNNTNDIAWEVGGFDPGEYWNMDLVGCC